MSPTKTLPAEFADLEGFLDWDLATEGERYAKRLASEMPEMQAFYDAAIPHMAEAMTFCDNYPITTCPRMCGH